MTLRDVGQLVGMRTPSLYTHFESKNDITAQDDIDLYVALVGGLIDAQLANDPGGDLWSRQLDRAIDMLADNLGIAP
jgi:AcrR family transcriptional regulator